MTSVSILGAGAMGSYFGARLALAGHTVTLIDPDEAHIETVRSSGLILLEATGARSVVSVAAVLDPTEVSTADLVIVLTKANRLQDALSASRHLTRAAPTLILCNGLGCADVAQAFVSQDALLHGATAAGAILDEPGIVRHTFQGHTRFGPATLPVPPHATQTAGLLTDAGLPAEAMEQVDDWVWSKLLVNIGYNAATALARIPNGALAGTASGRAVLEAAVTEAMVVARAKGITLAYDDPLAYVVDLGLGPIASNKSSMLQDVLRGRRTEIEFLNGAVSQEGRAAGIPTPVNDTLTRLVQIMDDHVTAMQSSVAG